MELAGAVALVTGGGGGIGGAVCAELTARGAVVVASGRNEERLGEVARRCGALVCPTDLRSTGAADELVDEVLATAGGLDVVVANAGVGHVGPFAAMSAEQVAELVDVNVRSTLLLARAAVRAFQEQDRSAPRRRGLCFVTSIAGAVGVPDESVYSCTKAAIELFAGLLREELRSSGVHVGTVVPGVVRTAFLDRRARPYQRRIPRPMPPEQVARAVVSVLEDERRQQVVPAWLGVPARLAATLPTSYRWLARRLS